MTASLLSLAGDPLTGRAITWSTSDPGVAQLDAGTGARVTVEAVGAGSATVRATAEGHAAAVEVEVLSGPAVELSASELRVAAPQGTSAAPVDVQIANGGHGTLSGLSTRVDYLDGGGTGWLEVALNGTAAPTSLTVIASAVALPPGVHRAEVQVHSPAGGGVAASLEVTFEVTPPPPAIVLASDAVGLASSTLSPIPAVAAVAITNGGSGSLDDLSVTVEYLGGGEGDGWLTASLAAAAAPTTLHLSALAAGMRPGDHAARVAIRSPVAVVSPVYLTVTFRVATTGLRGGADAGGGGR